MNYEGSFTERSSAVLLADSEISISFEACLI